MLDNVKAYFIHYRSERRGVILLAVILFLVYTLMEVFAFFYTPKVEELNIRILDANVHHEDSAWSSPKNHNLNPFLFNPNELSDSGYLTLGFSEKEIHTLRNFQAAGANFKVKKDFQKLFFIDSTEYALLEAFIQLPDSIEKSSQKPFKFHQRDTHKIKWSDTASYGAYNYTPFICNINTADTTELKKLNGVGSFYARKIIERREQLGGYHNVAQLLEIWKMTPEKIDKFASQVKIDLGEVKHIDMNSASAQELSRHPYLDFGISSKLVLKREELGGFKDAKELCSSGLLDAELCRKLAPYLKFN